MIILEDGIYDISHGAYLADPCEHPSLSSHIAHTLVTKTPLHAWTEHPRLGNIKKAPSDAFDLGTVAHSLFLEGIDKAAVIEANDWRTNAANAARDEARTAGKVPMLVHQYAKVLAMVEAARAFVARTEWQTLDEFEAERTMVICDGGVYLRGRPDLREKNGSVIIDYKSVGESGGANPREFSRAIFRLGYDIQAATYKRINEALSRLATRSTRMFWIAQEVEPPFMCSLIEADGSTLASGDVKLRRAMAIWRDALASGEWVGYPSAPVWSEAPPWVMAEIEAMEAGNVT